MNSLPSDPFQGCVKRRVKHKVLQAPRGHSQGSVGQRPPVTPKFRLTWEESWTLTSSRWGCAAGPSAPPTTHLRFMGRTLTATLTDAIAHPGLARAGIPPAQLPAAASNSPDSARCSRPLPSRPPPLRSAPDLASRVGPTCQATEHAQCGSGARDPCARLGGSQEAPRGGAGMPGRSPRRTAAWKSSRATRAESFQESWNPTLSPEKQKKENEEGGRRNLGPEQGPQSWGTNY